MKTNKRLLIKRLCIVLGVCLLVASILTLFFWNLGISSSEKQAKNYVSTLKSIIPTPQNAVLEERGDNNMPILSVYGNDFVGIIEFPAYDSELPVGAEWIDSSKYPSRFNGSIYDGTLQVGATTQKGQYDFYRKLSLGDTVVYTDMKGNRYTFEITGFRNAEHVDKTALESEEAQFTLFIKNIYSFEYLIVFCNAPSE